MTTFRGSEQSYKNLVDVVMIMCNPYSSNLQILKLL